MNVIDVSNWKFLDDLMTTGSRTKYWIKNSRDEIFLFKVPKSHGEIYAEFIAATLGEKIYGLKVPETFVAINDGTIGVLTKSFVERKKKERFEEIIDYYGADFDKDDLSQYTLEKSIEIAESYGLINDFYKMCVFDSIIGNQDRHCENWGFFYDSDNKISFSPLYDNGSSLLNNLSEEKVRETLNSTRMIDAYINRAKTCFSIEGKKRAKVKEMYPVLKAYNFSLLKETIEIFDLENYETINYVFSEIDDTLMSENRKILVKIIIEKRTKLFLEYANKEDEQ